MKKKLTNNLGLKLLSIFFAFFVWLVVVNISNPSITGTKTVTVEVANEDTLAQSQLTYNIVEKNTVIIKYTVRTLDEYKIKASDFRAYIDLEDLYEPTGSVPVKVEVINNRELIESVVAKPEVLHVETEKLQRKGFSLQVNTQGKPEEGYALGGTTLSTDFVYVRGPESVVGRINSVGIEVDTEGANSDLSGTAEPIFYDANGNQLSLGDKVTLNISEITYETQILKAKSLALDFEIAGNVADGYRYTGVEADVKSIPVVGLKSVLASLNSITIPSSELSIEGAVTDRVVKVDISKYLPPSTSLVGTKTEVTVTMKVEKLDTRTFSLNVEDIIKTGAGSQYTYQFDKKNVDVVVRGLSEDLDSLFEADLHASIDVTGMEAGIHKGVLSFNTGDAYEIISYSGIMLEIEDKEAETLESESETEETTTAETAQEETTSIG